MKTATAIPALERSAHSLRWLPIGIGMLLLYIPIYRTLLFAGTASERSIYGLCILALTLWLFWREHAFLQQPAAVSLPARGAGVLLLTVALVGYAGGKILLIVQGEFGSQIPLLFGLILFFYGMAGVRRLWFACLFLLFLLPVPASLLDQLLLPLKQWISLIVDNVLYAAGYPIARDGVTLQIGPYRLLIADACSGLNSMIALSGIGLLYVTAVAHNNRLAKLLLVLCILPIAFVTNVLRVIALALVTFYGGDAIGQRFHDTVAVLEIAMAFGSFFVLDNLLMRWLPARPQPTVANAVAPARGSEFPHVVLGGVFAAVAVATYLAVPQLHATTQPVVLEAMIPQRFEHWQMIELPQLQAPLTTATAGTRDTHNPYDSVLMRSYRNSVGDILMLALAYGRSQYQEIKIHRPELCYQAQGFSVFGSEPATFAVEAARSIEGRRLLAGNQARLEAVSYWIRIGDMFSTSAWDTRRYLFMQGLEGRIPDGMLVRVSQLIRNPDDAAAAFEQQREFLRELVQAAAIAQQPSLLIAANPPAE